MYVPTIFIIRKDRNKYFLIALLSLFFVAMTTPLLAQEQAKSSIEEASVVQLQAEKKPALKLGEATTNLLSLQVSGASSSQPLPMLGVTSNISWQRYLESFKYKIPETFENKVPKTDN